MRDEEEDMGLYDSYDRGPPESRGGRGRQHEQMLTGKRGKEEVPGSGTACVRPGDGRRAVG